MFKKCAPYALASAIACSLSGLAVSPASASDAKIGVSLATVAKLPDLWSGSWQRIQQPTGDGFPTPASYPLTAQAQKLLDDPKPGGGSFEAFANCSTPGMPSVMTLAAMPVKFMLAPGLISMWVESAGAMRFIRMDGRDPDPSPNPTFMGNSIGHWEGDTLVVDTRGFVNDIKLDIGAKPAAGKGGPPDQISADHGPNMRIVERIRLLGPNVMQIKTFTYDDTLYTKPVEDDAVYHRYTMRSAEPQEWFCSDNRDQYDPETNKTLYNLPKK